MIRMRGTYSGADHVALLDNQPRSARVSRFYQPLWRPTASALSPNGSPGHRSIPQLGWAPVPSLWPRGQRLSGLKASLAGWALRFGLDVLVDHFEGFLLNNRLTGHITHRGRLQYDIAAYAIGGK